MIKIERNFLSEREVETLSNWTLNNYKEPYFVDPKMNCDEVQTRFTTRHSHIRKKEYQEYKVKYPKEVYNVQNRLFTYLNLTQNSVLPFPSFTDGIVTTIAFSPGSCIVHKDPIYFPNTYTLHCNFCTQQPQSGGVTIIEDKEYLFGNRDLIMYISSHLNHEVTPCIGDIPRILWVFGFSISEKNLNRIFNIKKFNYY